MAKKNSNSGPVIIQLKSEADLAKLIDLVRANAEKVPQSLYDSSARWENCYFGDPEDQPKPSVMTFVDAQPNVRRSQARGRS
jgi:hypothetical protein